MDTAIFTEPLNCVMSGMDKIRLLPGETAVVIGAGPIGLYYIQLLKLNGAGKVIAVELNDFRKEYARKLGADLVISPSESGQILEATKGLGADVVIDAVGACIKDAVDWVRSSGRVLLFGLNFAAQQTICQTNITRKDLDGDGVLYRYLHLEEDGTAVGECADEAGGDDYAPAFTGRIRKRVRGDEGWKRAGSCDVSQWKIEYCDMIREQVFIFFMKACSFYFMLCVILKLFTEKTDYSLPEGYIIMISETVGGGSSDAVFYGGGSEGCGGYAEDV